MAAWILALSVAIVLCRLERYLLEAKHIHIKPHTYIIAEFHSASVQ